MVQVRRGYPARPGKTQEMPDWQPIDRFSRQRYAGSVGIRERRARGRCGEPGGTPNRSAWAPGGVLADGGCTDAVPVVVEEPAPTRARRLRRLPPSAVSHSRGLMGTDTERIVNLQPVVQHELPEPTARGLNGQDSRDEITAPGVARWTFAGEILLGSLMFGLNHCLAR